MYSRKGSWHSVRMAHTSAAEFFHRSSRSEGLLHSGNLYLRQQMHQTATTKTTHSAIHKNITGSFTVLVKCMKTPTSKPYIQYVWIPSGKAHIVNISSVCENPIMHLHKFTHQLNCTFIDLTLEAQRRPVWPLLTFNYYSESVYCSNAARLDFSLLSVYNTGELNFSASGTSGTIDWRRYLQAPDAVILTAAGAGVPCIDSRP